MISPTVGKAFIRYCSYRSNPRKLIFVSVFIKLLIFRLQWSEATSLLSAAYIPYTTLITFSVSRVADLWATFSCPQCRVTDSGSHLVQTHPKYLCLKGTKIQAGNLKAMAACSADEQYDLRKHLKGTRKSVFRQFLSIHLPSATLPLP